MTVHLPRVPLHARVARCPDERHAAVAAHARWARADSAASLPGGVAQTRVAAAVLPLAARQARGCETRDESDEDIG